jgi:predicted small lipoprotein YifL
MKALGHEGVGMKTAMLLLLAGLLLAACGKKGPPDPPGPPSEVIWPKTYPTR